MGTPEIKYGESMCFVQHVSTGLWLTYAAVDAKSARLGPLKRKVQKNNALLKVCMWVLTFSLNSFGHLYWICRPYSIKKVTWMTPSQLPDLRLKNLKLQEWFTAQRASLTSSSSIFQCYSFWWISHFSFWNLNCSVVLSSLLFSCLQGSGCTQWEK